MFALPNPVPFISDVAPPKITELRVIGDLREGSKVAVSCCFVGGVEGASRVQWFKTKSPLLGRVDELEAISTSKVAKVRVPFCLHLGDRLVHVADANFHASAFSSL